MYEEYKGNLRAFTGSGNLRYVLENGKVPEELVDKIVRRCER